MSGKQVAQYRIGGLIVNVEEHNIADKRCWELLSQDGVDVSNRIGEMLDEVNILRYQDFDSDNLSDIPTYDTVRRWCYL